MLKNKKFILSIKVILICLILFVFATGIGLIFLARSPKSAALFADNVLRPLIGNSATISLEGIVFNTQDSINHLFKHQPNPTSYITNVKIVKAVPSYSPPPNILPSVDTGNELSGEGVWEKIAGSDLFTTHIRTDPERLYSVVNLVYIPIKNISIAAVAGTKYPGGTLGKPGLGMIPVNVQKSGNLLAAFNGGFQERDGHYGMYSDGVTYVPLRMGLGTLFIYKNGKVGLSLYDGKPLAPDVLTARQNGPFLVENNITSKITSEGIDLWAGTASGGYVTWRSGIGITKDGDLIYAVGPSLTPTSLADALRLAGSQNAMQLDVNDFWVRFMVYSWNSKNKSYSYSPLIKGLADGGSQFLHGYEKDFFYLYKNTSQ